MVNVKAWSVAKRKAEGFSDIFSFMKRRRSGPKNRTTVTEVIQESIIDLQRTPTTPPPAASVRTPPAASARTNKPTAAASTDNNEEKRSEKRTRTNWSKGEDAKRMATTVEDWLEKKGKAVDENGEEVTLKS